MTRYNHVIGSSKQCEDCGRFRTHAADCPRRWARFVREPLREAVIFDMDGTLCDVTSIRHHVLGRRKNYDAFHYGSLFCPPVGWVAEKLHAHAAADRSIIVVTARKRKWHQLTKNWFMQNGLYYDEIHMRADDDDRKDVEVKRDIYAQFANRYRIIKAYDDNPSIVALWRSLGIETVEVPGWATDPEGVTG